jgi:Zn-dependent protease
LPAVSQLLVSFAVLLGSLSFHEAAHAWTANRLGDSTARRLGRLTLNPLAHIDWIGTVLFPLVGMLSGLPILGWAKPVPVDPRNFAAPRRDFALVALAGPVSNLILATAAALVLRGFLGAGGGSFGGDATLPLLADALLLIVVVNTLLAVFNLLPVPPLDGGNVAIGLLPASLGNVLAQLRPWGFLILYVLLFGRVLDRIVLPVQSFLIDWLVRR